MTIPEAVSEMDNSVWWDMIGDIPCDKEASVRFHAALDMAIAALRMQQASLDEATE